MKMRRDKHETTVMGEEPMWVDIKTLTDIQISVRTLKAINWYNYFCNEDMYREFVLEYCKQYDKEEYNKLKSVNKNHPLFRESGAVARILNLGGKVPPKDLEKFKVRYKHLLNLAAKVTEEVVEKIEEESSKPSVQDHIKNKAADTVSEMEVLIDVFLETDGKANTEFVKTFDPEAWIISRKLKQYECQAIHEHYSDSLKEKKAVLQGKDKQLVEGYAHIKSAKLTKYIKILEKIVDVSGQFALQKKERKPRKKKKKTADQLIKKLKYQSTPDADTGLTSADPRTIVGASKLLVYNTKTGKVSFYESQSLEGLSLKGSTLLNVNKAVCKTVRKPKEFFKNIAGVRSVLNHYDSLKTKEYEATPRINEHTIIVKAFK